MPSNLPADVPAPQPPLGWESRPPEGHPRKVEASNKRSTTAKGKPDKARN